MTAMTSSANALYLVFIWLGLLGLFREIYYITSFIKVKTIRFVTRYIGSRIKGLQRGGIRDHSFGSGITNGGNAISSVLRESGIRLSKVIIEVTKC